MQNFFRQHAELIELSNKGYVPQGSSLKFGALVLVLFDLFLCQSLFGLISQRQDLSEEREKSQ